MNKREYLRYSDELKLNGYKFKKNCPYEGRNTWVKYPDGDNQSIIEMCVYHGIGQEGNDYYNIRPIIRLIRTDCECALRLDIVFDTINIIDIESMFDKYVNKLK